jgi:hypothetical protein
VTLDSIVNPVVRRCADDLARRFAEAQPFGHVVIDDFLDPTVAGQLLEQFPAFERGHFIGENGEPGGKSTVERIRGLGAAYAAIDDTIQTPAFLELIGKITSIDGLLYDPFYLGGGTHENRHGQGLQAHIDFNYHPSERWHRRLNLIVYLNHEWEEAWGGMLDLYRDPYADAKPTVRVAPLFNRCVIFETTEDSWHGFDQILLPGDRRDLTRKSIALYFYTKDRPVEETAGRHTTHYVNRQLPDHFVEGHTLTHEDTDLVRSMIAQRDDQLRRLYDENASLLQAQDRGFSGHLLYLLKRLYVRYRR